ncbi:unnamed protein product [Calypogeia fissa]
MTVMSSQFLPIRAPLQRHGVRFSSRILPRPCSPSPHYHQPFSQRIRCTQSENVKCSAAVVGTPTFAPKTAEELQDEYGRQGLTFRDVDGTTFADLKLENGCKASVALGKAQITSYKAHMWHGGEEEMLHSVRTSSDSLRGGINLGFFYAQDPGRCILPESTECWRVEDVRCEPSNYAQITLSTSSNAEGSLKDTNQGCVQFRYVVTLTDKSLSSAVVVTNAGSRPVEFKGSIVSHLAVGMLEGTFAVGLNGCSYLSSVPTQSQQLEKVSEARDFFPPMWGAETNTREFKERGRWIVENEDYSQLHGGESRLYPSAPSSWTLLDRGLRRSLIIQRLGFPEFWLSNPGPDSELRDWDNFICLGPTQNTESVVLPGGEKWRAAQILNNPGYD